MLGIPWEPTMDLIKINMRTNLHPKRGLIRLGPDPTLA